jgi:hypothetical protein
MASENPAQGLFSKLLNFAGAKMRLFFTDCFQNEA